MKLDEFREKMEKGFSCCLTHQNMTTGAVYVLLDDTSYQQKGELIVEVRQYVLSPEQEWTFHILYQDNDYVVAMDYFNSCLNHCTVDPLEGLKFTCPECGSHRMECCQDGYHVSEVMRIDPDGHHDYGDLQSHGDVIRWQCLSCGYVLEFTGDITDNVEMAKWVKENCNEND